MVKGKGDPSHTGDGKTDLLHITGRDYVHPWISKGNGEFNVGFFRPWDGYQTSLWKWLVGDWDGDGKTDLIHIVGGDYVHPWLSRGDGTFAVSKFSPMPRYNGKSGGWVAADWSGDHKTDLVHLVKDSYVHPWLSGADQTTYSYVPAAPRAAPCVGCPVNSDVKVWANTNSGVYHCAGAYRYGKTREGHFMTQKEAQDSGYRPAYRRICK